MIYRDWQEKLSADIEVIPVCLPGREQRFMEPAIDTLDEMVRVLSKEIVPLLDRPYALFGYSMGGLIAHHLACHLAEKINKLPQHLFIAATKAPYEPAREYPLHDLPSRDFWSRIAKYEATPAEILNNAEYRDLFEPQLRADFKLFETANSNSLNVLNCPITVFGGMQDTSPKPVELEDWQQASTGPCDHQMFDGGHFFINSHVDQLVKTVRNKLEGN